MNSDWARIPADNVVGVPYSEVKPAFLRIPAPECLGKCSMKPMSGPIHCHAREMVVNMADVILVEFGSAVGFGGGSAGMVRIRGLNSFQEVALDAAQAQAVREQLA